MIATDGVRPVPSSVVGLGEVTLGEMISLSADSGAFRLVHLRPSPVWEASPTSSGPSPSMRGRYDLAWHCCLASTRVGQTGAVGQTWAESS